MIRRLVLALALLALGAGAAVTHEGEEGVHDHSARHDGAVEHTEHHHFELVAEGGTLALYVRHLDGSEEAVDGAKASATVLAGGKTEVVTLAPSGGNVLKGSGGFSVGKGTTIVVSVTLPGHATEQARFKLD